MSKMKKINTETIIETENLNRTELISLIMNKNRELNKSNEIFEMLSDIELISLVGDKNIRLAC